MLCAMRTVTVGVALLCLGCAGAAGPEPGPTVVTLAEASATASTAAPASAERGPDGPKPEDAAQVESTARRVEVLRMAAELWRATSAEEVCPTLDVLVRDRTIDAKLGSPADPWGSPYAIQCSDEGTSVRSAGPDRKLGTADDITSVSR